MTNKSFPWTTVAIFGIIVAGVCILAVLHDVTTGAFTVLVTLLPVVFTGAAYAENSNKELKNGLVVNKTKQALQETGVTDVVANANVNANAMLGAVLTQTRALQELIQRLPENPVEGGKP